MTLLLVDASGLIYRGLHTGGDLARSDGLMVGGIYRFVQMMWNLAPPRKWSHVGMAFENSRSFRSTLHPHYKAQRRGERPDAHRQQIPHFRRVAACFGEVVEADGFEADDVIATYAHAAAIEGIDVVIASDDKDLLQLVRPGVSVLRRTGPASNRRLELFRPEEVERDFGVRPERMCDLQALIGDDVDNIPGARGVGPKKAGAMLAKHGDLEALTKSTDWERHAADTEAVWLARLLVELRSDAPLSAPVSGLLWRPERLDALRELCREMEFTSFMEKISA